jgi:prepilin-type N-terminal cleavage/methylation domain-containing protein
MKNTNKSAFTMLELIFVIVALGIITSLAIPRLERDHLQDAAVQILQDIRYTQHLALMDDKTNPNNNNWQNSLWLIGFRNTGGNNWTYTIGSDMDGGGNIDRIESAIDPLNRKRMFGIDNIINPDESPRVFITTKFGVQNITFNNTPIGAAGNSNVQHLAFDYMGRPHRGILAGRGNNDYRTVMQDDLNITFTMSDNQTFSIIVEDQTGHAYIVGQDN